MKTVFMFSGQGAQYAGMGKELYQNYSVAKEIFDRADEVLGYSIKDICFNDEEKLGETEFAQPAILTMSIAAMKVLQEQGVRAEMTAGLSLGEYSAYVASGAMDFEEAVALVQKRGKFMAEAVPSGEGAMYAVIGLDTEAVEAACKEAVQAGLGLAIPANYNAPGQIVIAGASKAVAEAARIAKEKGATAVGITNNPKSTIGQSVDYHIQTATREKLFMNEICFSRVSAMTVMEILFLFLTVDQKKRYERTREYESLIADEKV